jgi:hypothetical protein
MTRREEWLCAVGLLALLAISVVCVVLGAR